MNNKSILKKFNNRFANDTFRSELNEFISELKAGKSPSKPEIWTERLTQLNNYISSINESNSQYEHMIELANQNIEGIRKENQELIENSQNMNRILTGLIDSLDEGYIIINRDGRCGSFISQQAQKTFSKVPSGEHLADIIDLPEESRESFEDWLNMIFMEVLSFDELAKLAPTGFKLKNSNKHVKVKFKPIRNPETNKITEIAMVIVDPTAENIVAKELGEQKLFTDMIIKYLNNKPSFIKLIQRTRETTDTLKSWTFNNSSDFRIQAINLAKELNLLKKDLNTNCMYSLGYKLHQAEDEIITFFDVSSNSQDGENLIHLIGQEIYESLTEFLNKYRHVFIFDNKTAITKEIPVESIYKFCAELLRMGLTDLLKYYVDEIVAVPLSSLFAPIEARMYSQSLSMDRSIDFSVIDYKKIRTIPEFYSLLFEELGITFNSIIAPKKNSDLQVNRINITLDLVKRGSEDSLFINFMVEIDKLFKFSLNENSEVFEDEINLFKLNKVTQEMGGVLELISNSSSTFTQFCISVPYVSELNSDVMDWLNSNSSKTGIPLLGTG